MHDVANCHHHKGASYAYNMPQSLQAATGWHALFESVVRKPTDNNKRKAGFSLSVLLGYGLDGGEGLCSLDIDASIVLAHPEQLVCQLLVCLRQGILVLLAMGVRVLGSNPLVGKASLCGPPGGLKGSWNGVKCGKHCYIIICSSIASCATSHKRCMAHAERASSHKSCVIHAEQAVDVRYL